jgi:hypothetical protein
MPTKTIVFSCRTKLEGQFYYFLSTKLNKKFNFYFLCFSQELYEWLKKKKINCFDVFSYKNKIPNIKLNKKIIFHEQSEFLIKNTKKIKKKYCLYFESVSFFFEKILKKNKNIYIIHEIGGFLSHQIVFLLAKKFNFKNIFIEPSFFNNRFLILVNSYFLDKNENINKIDEKIIRKFYKNFNKLKKVSFHSFHIKKYRNSYEKILDITNVKRLLQKIFNKYFLCKKEDYDQILAYSFQHILMFIKQLLQNLFYKNKLPKNFVYFPLHVPNDIALTIRAPKYLNQFNLLKKILSFLPLKYYLVIKEHPSFIGNYNFFKLFQILIKQRTFLANPSMNNFDIIKKSQMVVTINSKAGAESILLGKKIISLGDSFYKNKENSNFVKNFSKKVFIQSLNKKIIINKMHKISFLKNIFGDSYSGEMYNLSKKNLFLFSRSLNTFLNKN